MMGNAMINALIAAGIVLAIGYGWIAHLQNRTQRRSRAAAGGDRGNGGDTYTGSNDGFSLGSWFSGGSSGSSSDGGSCSSSDSGGGGGDCGGGGDGGGGGGGD
ncbi:hypothetical protein [Bradyrhizobium sp. 199]|uniref:hypothetical protein n=1 Tax=Bradyrhizobium sp. 199 TaxID=2782664 RepID=UPI001FFABFAA|nr:hypothetical protein [Bradyrhizobium sp. 199]MCK1358314.1 hypothetical protein [Bradyrhizobium sp. 199]